MQIEIKNLWTGKTLFSCDVPETTQSGMALRHALEKAAMTGADLTGADLTGAVLWRADLTGVVLTGAVLRGADLTGADLTGAVLRGADLRGADLTGADLTGAVLTDAVLTDANGKQLPRATVEQSIENLDKVRAIVMDDQARLNMRGWHEDEAWKERTCAEEVLCGTAHCIAGWLQVCSTEPALKEIEPQLAGILAAPVAAKMFFRSKEEAYEWLESRAYVAELGAVTPQRKVKK